MCSSATNAPATRKHPWARSSPGRFWPVTDCNDRRVGKCKIRVEFAEGTPLVVHHARRKYVFGGKRGTNRRTGLAVVSMATREDARIWITLDGTRIYED